MKKILPVILFTFSLGASHAQSGCNDPLANNFNSVALTNDGSCLYNASFIGSNLRGVISSYANESSGLVFANGAVWTHNDSGNSSRIYKADTVDGHLLQTISITNFQNTDWEDITADSAYLYLADCGNNDGNRTDLKILKIDKSQFLQNTSAFVTATAQAINFSYSDQTSFTSISNTNFDCESLISIGDSLYLFTKDQGDFQTRVYKLPKNPGTYTISPYTSYNVNGKITGACYNKQTKEIVLIGYLSSHKNSFLWFLNDFHGDMFFSGNKRKLELGNSTNDWQTEGIDFYSTTKLFISCENSYAPASLYTTLKSSISPVGLNTMKQDKPEIKLFPNPAGDKLTINVSDCESTKISIYNVLGETVLNSQTINRENTLDISSLKQGTYFVFVSNSKMNYQRLKLIKQ